MKLRRLDLCAAALAVVLCSSTPIYAQLVSQQGSLVAVSDSAGATLLAPYFEVDLNDPNGRNTIITVGNTGADGRNVFNNQMFQQYAAASSLLAHVTVWSDLGVPVFNFTVYLTGYDVERIDMRKVLNGILPITATAGQDPLDTISPKGTPSQDINFASCGGNASTLFSQTSLPPPATLTAAQISNLQTSLTGRPSPNNGNKCAGRNLGDRVARGYVTIDAVDACSNLSPADAGYFRSVAANIGARISLTGEVFYVDQNRAVAYGGNLVHIHSSTTDPLVTTSGNYTFYGRYVNWTAADGRQPLATNFNARFLSGSFSTDAPPVAAPGSTSLIVWRDSKVAQGYFACNAPPSWYPLNQEWVEAFDEQEHPFVASGRPFPAATQVVKVGGSQLPLPFTSGWISLGLNHAAAAAGSNPPADPAAAQAWVQVLEQGGVNLLTNAPPLNVLRNAQQFDNATKANHSAPF